MVALSTKAGKTPRRAARKQGAAPALKATPALPGRTRGPQAYRFTAHEYHRLGELGILKPDERVELIEGEIVMMPPIDISHAQSTHNSLKTMDRRLEEAFDVRCQQPVSLGPLSEPVPDISVVRLKRYTAHPTPADIALILEVANTSLEDDLVRKKRMYAAAGVPEYWVLDVVSRVLHVFSVPKRGDYTCHQVVAEDETVQSPTLKLLRLDVAGLLP